MKHSLIVLLALAASAHADPVWRSTQTTLRLTMEPCREAKIEEKITLKAPSPPVLRAVITYRGRVIEACWTMDAESKSVVVMDVEGDIGLVPMKDFKQDRGDI